MSLLVLSKCLEDVFGDQKNILETLSDVKIHGGSNGANGLKIGIGQDDEIRLQRVSTESVVGSFWSFKNQISRSFVICFFVTFEDH